MEDAAILLVDDEQAIVDLLETVLRKEGFSQIHSANTAETALEACKNKPYDLIVLDIMLPGRSGLEILPFIRIWTDAPILFLTARSSDLDKLTGFAIGGDDYITKPFNPLEVVARMRAQLRRYLAKSSRSGVVESNSNNNEGKQQTIDRKEEMGLYRCGRFSINERTGELQVEGSSVACPALVFQLLLFFCKHPNQIFSKSELYERIWDGEALGDDNTVMVHIHRARERIEKDPANPQYLVNIRGLGYKLVKQSEVSEGNHQEQAL